MHSKISEDYATYRAWFRDIIGGKMMILRNVSALEFLQLFVGYDNETDIEVYSYESGKYSNIQYRIVDSFDKIEYALFGDVMCSTINQAVNDMLSDYDNMDELALTEALSNYYFEHGESFDGINIKPENIEAFNHIKERAITYYDYEVV